MTTDTRGNIHQPAGTHGAGQFTGKANCTPVDELQELVLDDEADDLIFDTEIDGVGYGVHDAGDGDVAYSSAGGAIYFSTPSVDHASIEDALRSALDAQGGR